MSDANVNDHYVLDAMERYGGSFVGAVARLFRLADADNQRRIKAAFPEYFEKYKDASRRLQVAETVAAPLKGEAHE